MIKQLPCAATTIGRIVSLMCLCLFVLGCEERPPRFAEDMRPRNGGASDDQGQSQVGSGGEGTDKTKQPPTSESSKDVPIPIVGNELQRKAITSTVRLIVEPEVGKRQDDTGFGSGAIVGKDEEGSVYILTVWHAAKHGIRCIDFFGTDSKPVATCTELEIVGNSPKRDLALLKAQVDSDVSFSTVDLVPGTKTRPAYGYSVGCSSGRRPNVLGERIVDDKVVGFEGSETRARSWITDLPQEGGRSGGALLDPDGRLLGIASKATVKGYYIHAEEIRQFLSETNL